MQPNAKILKVMIYLTTFQVETSSKSKYKIKMAARCLFKGTEDTVLNDS